MRLPGMSSRNGRNELSVVFGPSRKTSLAATMSRIRSCSFSPSSPASAKPAAKIITKHGRFLTTSSSTSTGFPDAMTARSISPGMSWMLAKQGRPSISSYFGLTGWTMPPSASTFFLTVAHSSLVLLPLVADAPIMATTRGWKNRSSGTSRKPSVKTEVFPALVHGVEGGAGAAGVLALLQEVGLVLPPHQVGEQRVADGEEVLPLREPEHVPEQLLGLAADHQPVGRVGGDRLGVAHPLLLEVVARDDRAHHAPVLELLGGDAPAGEDDLVAAV